MTRRFASRTAVAPSKSRAEIEALVRFHGATGFASGWQGDSATIMFEINGRRLRFVVPLPSAKSHPNEARREQEERRMWRCLLLAIRAKFEAVASGIAVFDDEFLANIVIPDGTGNTVSQRFSAALAAAYDRGVPMPPLLGPAS